MSQRKFTVRPLTYYPFISIVEAGMRGENPVDFSVEPQPASPITQVKFSPDKNQMALVYDLRVEEMPVFGNPNIGIPQGGFRIFSGDDRFLLFGGTETEPPLLFRRSGPTYMLFNESYEEIPEAPVYFTFGAFSNDGLRLAVIRSDQPDKLRIYQRGLMSNLIYIGSITVSVGVITDIAFSPKGKMLIVRTDNGDLLYDNRLEAGAGFPAISNLAATQIFGLSADDTLVLCSQSDANNVEVHNWNGTQFSIHSVLEQTAGVERSASFSPDQNVIQVSGAMTVSGMTPMFFALHENEFLSAGGISRANASSVVDGEVKFRLDSQQLVYPIRGAGNTAEFLKRSSLTFSSIAKLPDLDPLPNGNGFAVDYSPLADHVAFANGASPFITLYGRNGDQYAPLPNQLGSFGTRVYAPKFSPDGQYLAIGTFGSPYLSIYKRDGDTYSRLAYPTPFPPSIVTAISWSKDANFVAVTHVQPPYRTVYKRTGDTFEKVALEDLASGYTSKAIAFSPDGAFLAVGRDMAPFLDIYSISGDTFTRLPNQVVLPSNSVSSIAFSPDSKTLVVGGSGSPNIVVYHWNGTNFVKQADPSHYPPTTVNALTFNPSGDRLAVGYASAGGMMLFDVIGTTLMKRDNPSILPTGSVQSVCYSPDGLHLAYAHSNAPALSIYKDNPPVELATYVAEHTVQNIDSLKVTYSPDGGILHISSRHMATITPYNDFLTLPFNESLSANQISEVQYSYGGSFVLHRTTNGLSISSKKEDNGDYILLDQMTGKFVSVYNQDRANRVFVEKDYIYHAANAEISNMVFSQTPIAFSYFSLNSDSDDDAESPPGRHVYHTFGSNYLQHRGTDFTTDMMSSYLAFSPFEGYFASTYRKPNNTSDVVLYKFTDAQLNFAEVDRKTVSFGPLDFSGCDKIIVAHGGTEYPFTIYDVDTENDKLIEKPYPPMDWQHDGIVLDIKFIDCDNFVVVTPEEIITVTDPEDGDPEETDAVERDDDVDNPNVDIVDNDGNTSIIVNPGGGGGGGNYETGPGGTIVPLTYTPYVAVNVFYRE